MSLRRRSTSAPLRPITMPGRAVRMNTQIWSPLRSMSIDRDAGAREPAADVLADPDVLVQLVGVVAAGVPVGLPGVDDPQPEPVRVDLVTHLAFVSHRLHHHRHVRRALADPRRTTVRTRPEALAASGPRRPTPRHHQVLAITPGCCSALAMAEFSSFSTSRVAPKRREPQDAACLLDVLAADHVDHPPHLARRRPDVLHGGLRLQRLTSLRSCARPARANGTCAWARTRRACARPSTPR